MDSEDSLPPPTENGDALHSDSDSSSNNNNSNIKEKKRKKSKKGKKKKASNNNSNKEKGKEESPRAEDEEEDSVFDPLEQLTDEQKELLHQFKLRLGLEKEDGFEVDPSKPKLRKKEKKSCNNMCLCRFLRAREWDLDASELMLRNTLKWRHEYKPHKITAQEIEYEARQSKMYILGTDRENRPVVYMKPGLDIGVDRVLKHKYLVWILEQAIERMDESKGIERMSWICDFSGTGMRNSSVENIKLSIECLHTVCDHYPERLGVAFLINTPWVFTAFWKCISPLLNPVTLAKIKICGGEYREQLHAEVDPVELERAYGGENDYVYDHQQWMKEFNVTPPEDS